MEDETWSLRLQEFCPETESASIQIPLPTILRLERERHNVVRASHLFTRGES